MPVKILPFLSLVVAALTLSACVAVPAAGVSYIGVTQTKPDDPPPADTADQIAAHDSWCYETLGYPECFTRPQNVDANRLINVDPASSYPLTPQAYRDATLAGQSYPPH